MSYVIEREDGHFYLGTIDGKPVFGHGESAAVFAKEADADRRRKGLEDAETEGREFSVVPDE